MQNENTITDNVVIKQIEGLREIFNNHLSANYQNISISHKEEIFHIETTTYFLHTKEAVIEIIESYLEDGSDIMRSMINSIKIELVIDPTAFFSCYEKILHVWKEKGVLKNYKVYYDRLIDSQYNSDRFHDIDGAFVLRLLGQPDINELIQLIQAQEKQWAYPRPTIITLNSDILFNWSFLSLEEICQYLVKGIDDANK